MKKKVAFIVVSILALAAPSAWGRQPLTTQDAYPAPVHRVEFETGFHYVNYPGGDEAYRLDTELNYGLINNLDLGIEIPFIFYRPDQGDDLNEIGDIVVKSRLLFLKGREGNPISLTFQPFLKLPIADERVGGSEEVDIGFVLIGTRDLYPILAHLNVGYVFVGNPPGASYDDVFLFRVALEYLADPKLQLVGELTAETNRVPDADDAFAFLIGARYLWFQNVSLDTGLSVGLSDGSPDYRGMLGISINF
jgi:hypothetical protein